MKTEAEIGGRVYKPRNTKDFWKAPEAKKRQGTDSFLEPAEDARPCQCLNLGLLTFRMVRQNISGT